MIKFVEFTAKAKEPREYAERGIFRDQFRFSGSIFATEPQMYTTFEEIDVDRGPLLKKDLFYLISIDQSTSNSGIFIKSVDNTHAILLEVSKQSGQKSGQYIQQLEHMLCWLNKWQNIVMVLPERAVLNNYYNTTKVLMHLYGMIRDLPECTPEYTFATVRDVPVTAWRAEVILPEYEHCDKKTASRLSIQHIYPWLTNYGSSIGKDEDAFEAAGIMFGWMCRGYDPLAIPMNPEGYTATQMIAVDKVVFEQRIQQITPLPVHEVTTTSDMSADLRVVRILQKDKTPVLVPSSQKQHYEICAITGLSPDIASLPAGSIYFLPFDVDDTILYQKVQMAFGDQVVNNKFNWSLVRL